MHKLLFRAFPGWYRANSIYALYPFTTPEGSKQTLEEFGMLADYDFTKPTFIPQPRGVTTWQGVVDVLSNQEQLKVPCQYNTFPAF